MTGYRSDVSLYFSLNRKESYQNKNINSNERKDFKDFIDKFTSNREIERIKETWKDKDVQKHIEKMNPLLPSSKDWYTEAVNLMIDFTDASEARGVDPINNTNTSRNVQRMLKAMQYTWNAVIQVGAEEYVTMYGYPNSLKTVFREKLVQRLQRVEAFQLPLDLNPQELQTKYGGEVWSRAKRQKHMQHIAALVKQEEGILMDVEKLVETYNNLASQDWIGNFEEE